MSGQILNNSLYQISGNFTRYFLQIVRVGVIARYVLPEDYGLVASVLGILGLSTLLGDFGLTAAAIQKKELSPNHEKAFFGINILIGLVLFIILALAAPLVGLYLKDDRAVNIVLVLAVNYLLIAIFTQPLVKLKRQLAFKKITLVEVSATVISSIVGVILAIKGYRYWALIYMRLTETILFLILYLILSRQRMGRFILDKEVKSSIRFGFSVNLMNILNRLTKNLDMILLGRFAGLAVTGFYSRAIMLTNLINVQLRGAVFAVSFPVMSKEQDDESAFYKSFYETFSILVFFNCIAGGALFWFAHQLIPVYLGEGWEDVIFLLRILCFGLIFVPFNTILDQIPLAKGNARLYNKVGIVKNLIRLILIVSGTLLYGVIGCAAGIVIGEFFSSFAIYFITIKEYRVDIRMLLITLGTPLVISVVAGFLSSLIPEFGPDILSLVLAGLVYSLLFLGLYRLLDFPHFIKISLEWNKNKK